jgi:hypothetical protein
MADFAPKLTQGIQPTEAVSGPSVTSGLLSAISGFLPTREAPEPPKVSLDDNKKLDQQAFYSQMEAARQAKEQGNTTASDRIARNAYRTYVTQYGSNDDSINSEFSGFTGIPVNLTLGNSISNDAAIAATPEYQSSIYLIQAENPDLPDFEVHQLAVEKTKALQANTQAIATIEKQREVDWYSAEKVYTDRAVMVGNDIQSALKTIKKDEIITPEEASQLRAKYNDMFGGLQKPAGVPDARWKSFQDNYIVPVTTAVEAAIGLGQDKNIAFDTNRAISAIIAKAVSQDKLPVSLLARLQPDANGAYSDVLAIVAGYDEQIQKGSQFFDAYQTLKTGSFGDMMALVTEFENQTPEVLNEVNTIDFKATSPNDQREQILANATALGTGEGTAGILAVDLNDIVTKVELLDTSALQPEDLGKVFNPAFFTSINTVYEANPSIGLALADKARNAVASQRSAVSNAFISEARQRGLVIQNGVTAPDLSNPASKSAANYVDKYFGGSFEKAIAAKGVTSEVAGRQAIAQGYQNFLDLSKNMSYMQTRTDRFTAVDKQLALLEGNLPKPEVQAIEAPQGPQQPTQYKLPEEVAKDTEFLNKVNKLSSDQGIKPEDILRVIDFESAQTWNPAIKNPNSTATGLIQFMSSTAKGLGTTTDALAKMSRAEQMDYVAKYLEPYKGRLKNFGDVYMAVHWPKAIGKDETYVMYEKGSKEYTANKNLDTNNDGTVTRGETVASVISRTGRGVGATAFTQEAATFAQEATANIESVMPPQTSMQTPIATVTPTTTTATDTTAQATPTNTVEAQTATSAEPTVSKEAQALVSSLGEPDANFTTNEEFLAASAAGKFTAGDVILVDGVTYVIRKDGTPVKVGG